VRTKRVCMVYTHAHRQTHCLEWFKKFGTKQHKALKYYWKDIFKTCFVVCGTSDITPVITRIAVLLSFTCTENEING
jgi:hypothetical protein